jgi:D-alanyl-D-alanine dipeptidase
MAPDAPMTTLHLRPWAMGVLVALVAGGAHAKPRRAPPPAAETPAPPSVAPAFPPGTEAILPGLVDVGTALPDSHVELKYGTRDNFMHQDVYGGLHKCFLVDDAARMLGRARQILKQRAPGLTFAFYDCARPVRVQRIMFGLVAGTPQQGYVANPDVYPGSLHNTGCAVDMGLWDTTTNAAVDMGTPFDFFGPKAEPRHELELWSAGKLTGDQWANRLLLREVMLRAGFRVLAHEWWHFECATWHDAKTKYTLVE